MPDKEILNLMHFSKAHVQCAQLRETERRSENDRVIAALFHRKISSRWFTYLR